MILYEVYISRFNDTNKDSVGDIKGIIDKVDYFKDLGVDTLWITPFYNSPLVDNGYDVSDYLSVDSRFGTITDMKELIDKVHQRDMKIIIDVVLNHSSDKHEWFIKSENGEEKYRDYYIWRDEPLNNWESMFKGSCWTYSEKRQQYYLHRFAKEQPDLNFLNPVIIEETTDVLKYWLNLGVDGFRFDVINFLITDEDKLTSNNEDDRINHNNTYDVVRHFKRECKKIKKDVIFVGEVGSEELDFLKTYISKDMMDFVFNFNISSQQEYDLEKIVKDINDSITALDNVTVLFSSHDMSRYYRRLAKYDLNKYYVLSSLLLLNDKVSVIYQGDELKQLDYEPKNIDEIFDVQATNEIEILKNTTNLSDEEIFSKVITNVRDFSRNLVDFSLEIDKEFRRLVKIKKEIIRENKLLNIEYEEKYLTFNFEGFLIRVNHQEFDVVIKENFG